MKHAVIERIRRRIRYRAKRGEYPTTLAVSRNEYKAMARVMDANVPSENFGFRNYRISGVLILLDRGLGMPGDVMGWA